jgi:hypothetical protein
VAPTSASLLLNSAALRSRPMNLAARIYIDPAPIACDICLQDADVQWPVRGRYACRSCVTEARAFIAESAARHPKLGEEQSDAL